MAKKGMTPEQVQKMSQRLHQGVSQINNEFKAAKSHLDGLDWTGEDRTKFLHEFDSEIGNLVKQVTQKLDEFSQKAKKNADQQTQTSSH